MNKWIKLKLKNNKMLNVINIVTYILQYIKK